MGWDPLVRGIISLLPQELGRLRMCYSNPYKQWIFEEGRIGGEWRETRRKGDERQLPSSWHVLYCIVRRQFDI